MDAIQQMKDELKSFGFVVPAEPQRIPKKIGLQFTENRLRPNTGKPRQNT